MVLKPSEVSAATDGLIAELIPKYLSQVKIHLRASSLEERSAAFNLVLSGNVSDMFYDWEAKLVCNGQTI